MRKLENPNITREIIEKARDNEEFAREFEAAARRAAEAGTGTDEWEAYMRYFASSPLELARLRTPGRKVRGAAAEKTIMMTLMGTHTFGTGMTGFTETLSMACASGPGRGGRQKSPARKGATGTKAQAAAKAGKAASTKKATAKKSK